MPHLRCWSVSLGCPKNRVDTERLLGSLGVRLVPVDTVDRADVAFVNTCGFIAPAVQESIHVIAQAIADLDGVRRKPLLVVGGCLVGRYGEAALAPELPEVDLWLDNARLDEWPRLLMRRLHLPDNAPEDRWLSTPPSFAWLKISDGCRHGCAFCTIPRIRGPLVSRPAEDVAREAKSLLRRGVKELVLVAQDVSDWGRDRNDGTDLRHLLDRLLPLDGLRRLRLLYLYPTGLDDGLLTYLRDAGNPLVPYFDVPLQHSHKDVLSRMGRPFAGNPRFVIDRIRTHFPDAALRTSLIVGFPGETEAHFADLVGFVEETRFQHLGVFEYQAEEGTPAASLPDQIADDVKAYRKAAVMSVQRDISAQWLAGFTGRSMEILVDAPHPEWPGLHTGRTWFQAPEIDGLTYVSGEGVAPGNIVTAEITESSDYDLTALV